MRHTRPGPFIAVIVLSAFGAFLLLKWSSGSFHDSALAKIIICGVAALLIAVALVQLNRVSRKSAGAIEDRQRERQRFFLVLGIEVVAIFVASQVLLRMNHSEWIIAAVLFIVGAHFFPLARIFQQKAYWLTGAALILLALGLPIMSNEGPSSATLPLCAGVVLWLTAVYVLLINRSIGERDSRADV